VKNKVVFFTVLAVSLCIACNLYSARERSIIIHLRGVSETKISLIPFSGAKPYKPVSEILVVKNGETSTITIPGTFIPSEFVLRYDYKENANSTPYPAEQHLFVGNQDLELWVNPLRLHDSESTHFQRGEKENSVFETFNKENTKQKEKLGLLQNFLMKYDEPDSKLYSECISEFEKRRTKYNDWLAGQVKLHNDCFVSTTFMFQYIPPMDWKGNEAESIQCLMTHYFDGTDFKEPLILKTTDLKEWMDKYVNLYGSISTTPQLRDSLFTLAGYRAIEKAKGGNSKVYGWMVDYFFNGYETNGIAKGIKMLEPYINDPHCLTAKKLEIEKRLKGMETLKPGIIAPDFQLKNGPSKSVSFHSFKTDCKYKLVLFWSADCSHCKELVGKLFPWYQQLKGKNLLNVFALSVDNTETEIPKWNEAIKKLPGWIHHRCVGGINSTEANSYYILSTPTMILVETKTNTIVSLPENFAALQEKFGF